MVDAKFDEYVKGSIFSYRGISQEDKDELRRCWDAAQDVMRAGELDITFKQLSEANRERQPTVKKFRDSITWTPADWITAICGELGEAANFIKKKKRGDADVVINDILKELADVIIYTDILIQMYHYDTGAVVVAKFNEVSDRVGSDVKL